MPVGTFERLGTDDVVIKLEIEGTEQMCTFKTTPKVHEWVANHPAWFSKGSVVDYAVNKDGVIGKITQAGGFKKGSEPKPKTQQELWEEKQKKAAIDAMKTPPPPKEVVEKKAEAAGFKPPTGTFTPEEQAKMSGNLPLTNRVTEKTYAPPKEVVGSFDPAKVHGYEVIDTCQIVQYEPITIKVIGDDPDTCRKALIEAWGIFGQYNEVTRETVTKHIQTHLLRKV